MPRRIDISSILIVGTAAVLAVSVPPALAAAPTPEWAVSCRAGDDGFASNCAATRRTGDYVLRLQSADSQVFVSILHPRCETNYRNFDRTDVAGLEAAERRALVERAFHEIEAEVRRTCPTLTPPPLALGAMPDIAVLPAAEEGWSRIEVEFPDVRANCGLSGTLLERDARDARLLHLIFRHRNAEEIEARMDGRLACAEHWARERGYRLTTAGPNGVRALGTRAAADEFPAVARNCALPDAVLGQFTGSSLRGTLLLPPELYARRGERPVAGRIACIEHWAHGRGLRLFVAEARP